MANEVLASLRTTTYVLDAGDILYVAENGTLRVTTGTDRAIQNVPSGSGQVWIDGSVTLMATPTPLGAAVLLEHVTPLTSGTYLVTVGATGVVTGIQARGILLEGRTVEVRNDGTIKAATGVSLTGQFADVRNGGAIIAGTGIEVFGAQSGIVNTGSIDAQAGIVAASDLVLDISNAGRINAVTGIDADAQNIVLVNAGVVEAADLATAFGSRAVDLSGFDTARMTNTGTLTASTGLIAVAIGGNGGSTFDMVNDGSIAALKGDGIRLISSSQIATLVNTGAVSGGTFGVYAETGVRLHLTNAATGTISANEDAALVAQGRIDLVNLGDIMATGPDARGIVLGSGSGNSVIVNRGTISATFGAAVDADMLVSGGTLFVRNHGVIEGSYIGAEVTDSIINRGTMELVGTQGGNDTLRNRGLIDGPVLLGAGADTYDGRRGELEVYADGGTGNDTMTGGALSDDLRGGTDADSLTGGDGDDTLQGGTGSDVLSGGNGDDVLTGGADRDTLAGGAGADRFVFGSAAEAGLGATADRIVDFTAGTDDIVLSGFMAGATFRGTGGYVVNGQPQVRYDAAAGIIYGDTNGDGASDFAIVLLNKPALTAGDFVF